MALKPGLWGIETEAQQLASMIARTLPVTVASVALWDDPSLTLTVKAVHAIRPQEQSLPIGVRVPLADAAWHRVAFERSEPVLLESGSDRPIGFEQEAALALLPHIRSMYLVPIRFAGETVGVLALGEARAAERDRFSTEKQQRCQAILDEFVASTAHAWEARRLRRQVRAMSSMVQLVRGVSTARSFDDVLVSLAAEVADWLGIPVRGALLRMMGREIRLLARWQLPDEVLSDGGRQMVLAMTRSGAKESGPVTVTVAGDDPLDPLAAAEPAAKKWTRIGVPLMRDERLIGVACLYLEDEVRLADWELEALRRRGEIAALGVEAVGMSLTIAAERQRSHRMAFELLTGYRRMLLEQVFADLARSLPASCQERLRGTLPGLIDQRQPAGESTGLDRRDLVSAVLAEVSAAFTEIWESSGLPEAAAAAFDVNDLVVHAVHIVKTNLEELLERHGIAVDVCFEPSSEPVVISGSPVLIGALVHAIENAAEAMPLGGRIQIRTTRDNGDVLISIRDEGTGISDAVAETAFNPLYSTKGGPHLGLGLSVVRSVVQRLGGTVRLRASEAAGTELVIRIPVVTSSPGALVGGSL
jgi:signal transduction histidine kinase